MAGARDPYARVYERLGGHRFGWVAEPMVEEASFVLRPMFGSLGCYLHGRLMLILADRRPPWCGLLVPTAREVQASLRAEMPALQVHSILGKWLHLPESAEDFDAVAETLVRLALLNDARLGVEPRPKRRSVPSMGRPRRRTKPARR
jgi:hypothetical protein